MPIKDKTMSIIRLRPCAEHSLASVFGDIFYRDKSSLLANSALYIYNKLKKTPEGLKPSEWEKHVSEIFKVNYIENIDFPLLKDLCQKHSQFLKSDSKTGLRGKKPYKILLKKFLKNEIKLSEQEEALLKRVSKWNSAVSSYYSIINKLKAIGIIEKKQGCYILSNKFANCLKSIENSLQLQK